MVPQDEFVEIPARTGSSRVGQPTKESIQRIGDKRISPRSGLTVRSREQGWVVSQRNAARRRSLRMGIYLKVLAETGRKYVARRAADGLSSSTVYEWRKLNIDGFRDREDAAMRMAADDLEDLAVDRAYEGSDFMLAFLLNGLRPDRYTGGKGGSAGQGEGSDPRAVAHELRRVWEEMDGFCPPAPDPVEGARDVTPTEVSKE